MKYKYALEVTMIRGVMMLRYHLCLSQVASHLCQVTSQRKDSLGFRLPDYLCVSSPPHSVDCLVIPGIGTEEVVYLLAEIMDTFPAVLGGKRGERK